MDQRWVGIGSGLLAALIWGGFPVMTRLGVAHSSLDPYDVTFIRFAVSGALLLPILLRRSVGKIAIWPSVLMVTGIGAPYMLVVTAGLGLAPVGLFAILTPGSMIAFAAVLGAVIMKEQLSVPQKIGIATILIGVGITGYNELESISGGAEATTLFLFGGLLWAIYTVTTRAFATEAFMATAIVSVGSGLTYGPVYLALKGAALFHAPWREIVVQGVYQGVLVSVLALYFYSKSVSILGPTVGATFAALVPVLAVIEAALLLGEWPHPIALVGLAIVTCGMIVSLVRPRSPGH